MIAKVTRADKTTIFIDCAEVHFEQWGDRVEMNCYGLSLWNGRYDMSLGKGTTDSVVLTTEHGVRIDNMLFSKPPVAKEQEVFIH